MKAKPRNNLLIEIGTEDLPARFVQPLARALGRFATALADKGIACGESRIFATPRRIAVLIQNVAARQTEQAIERKGPKLAAALKDGVPTAAGMGFAKSCGVEFSALAQENGQLVFRSKQPGRAIVDLVPEIFEQTLKSMDELVPKRMRWGNGEETFVRPVQWIVGMLGAKVIPLKRFGLKSSNKTYGHRFHAPKAIALKSPAEYEKKLRAAKVWADFDLRRAEIRQQIEAEAARLKGRARIDAALLDEVTALVEWPVVISGRIEERFLQLPTEVIIATIEHNQRYFPVFGRDEKLLPAFITVSNIQSKDRKQVISGNERVVVPRLADAMFFWEQDRRRPLEANLDALDRVAFTANRTLLAKARHVEALAGAVAAQLNADTGTVRRAAELCKADLVTRMVYEFPELQGVMGGYYAKHSGETDAVAAAIREHYQPAQAGAAIPATQTGRIVALADKLDTLAGIFAIGQKPTSTKDPFGLRRAALGALRILIEGVMPLHLRPLLAAAVRVQPAGKQARDDEKLAGEIFDFMMERLRAWYLDQDVAPEVFEAVLATGADSPLDFHRRVGAVRAFLRLPAAKQLSAAHKRVRNILRQAGQPPGGAFDSALAKLDAELNLAGELGRLQKDMQGNLSRGDYEGALGRLAQLQNPVDLFFETVMVMDEDTAVRANRLNLLAALDRHCRSVADISHLPGQ